MSKTDFFGKDSVIPLWVLCCFLLSISWMPGLHANEATPFATLVCDDQINVALDGNCESNITVDMILEGESTIPNFDPANLLLPTGGIDCVPHSLHPSLLNCQFYLRDLGVGLFALF